MLKIFLIFLLLCSVCFAQSTDTRVWLVVKLNYRDSGNVAVQPMGTAFFVSNNNFLTAAHVVGDTNTWGRFTHYKYFLVNADGTVLSDIKILARDEDSDFALGSANTDNRNIYVWKYTDIYTPTMEVYQVGFSKELNDRIMSIRFKRQGANFVKDTIAVFTKEFNGYIIGDMKGDWIIDDVRSKERTVIYVNFNGGDGNSGGPLVLKDTDEAIGIFSFGNIEQDRSMSVRIKDYMELIKSYENNEQTLSR